MATKPAMQEVATEVSRILNYHGQIYYQVFHYNSSTRDTVAIITYLCIGSGFSLEEGLL